MTRTIECAMARTSASTHQDFQDRHVTLATIASLAPSIGLFCTVLCFVNDAFPGGSFERSQWLAATAKGIAFACIPTAFGIVLGLLSLWGYRYFQHQLCLLDRQMTVTAAAWMEWFRVVDPSSTTQPDHEPKLQALDCGRDSLADFGPAAIILLGLAWFIRTAVLFWLEYVPMASAPGSAFRSLLFSFLCSFLVVYAVWVDLLHRKRSKVVAIAAGLSVVWAIMRPVLNPALWQPW